MRSIAYRARFYEGLYARGLLESLLVLEWGYAASLPPEGGGYSHSRSIKLSPLHPYTPAPIALEF